MMTTESTPWARCFPQLAEMHDPAWRDAVASAPAMEIPEGAVVMRPGDACRHVFLLSEGIIRVYLSGENGREVVLYRVHPGELCVLTLTSLLRNTHYPAEAATESAVRGVGIPAPGFIRAFSDSPAFRQFVVDTLAQRLHETMLCVQELAFMRLDVRLPWFLCKRFQELGTDVMEITHQQLAHELGTTREMVSRLLKELERQNHIRLHRGRIELVSPDRLRGMIAR